MSSTTPHWERIHGALAGAEVDRIPVSFWRHFPGEDETPEGLAAATLRWQTTFDFDLVKFMPTGTYGVHDWGAETEYGPPSGGTRGRQVRRHFARTVDEATRFGPGQGCAGPRGRSHSAGCRLAQSIGAIVPDRL